MLAVGVGTTGLTVGAFILICPDDAHRTLKESALDSPEALRRAFIVCGLVAGIALVIACLGAWGTRISRGGSYSPNVWRSTLGLRREAHVPYVVLELKDDDRRIEGVLPSYTTLDSDHPRDIALMAPKITKGGEIWDSGAGYVLVSADEIAKIQLTLAADPGQPK